MKKFIQLHFLMITLAWIACNHYVHAQSLKLDNLKEQFGKGKPFKLGGGLSANGIGYSGNGGYGRSPFSYILNGSLALNLYGLVNLPVSFTLSDFGAKYAYPIPPNRLSIHPSYKSVTAHIGHVSMNYSPYTVNGYLFTGAGVDVEPENGFKASAFYGRLQRAVEYDTANHTVPAAYERFGYGSKVEFQHELYKAGIIVFHAADELQSLENTPDSLQIYPVENTVVSVNAGTKLMKNLDLSLEYATSALTQDIRAEKTRGEGLLRHVVNSRSSTGFYNAMKLQLQYTLANTVMGVAYEKVDPGYQTLGTYFMNNDLENITVNAAQPLFDSKLQVAVNAGYQRDNLDGTKSGSSSRAIAAVNANFSPTEKFSGTASYSNFQSYMRIRPQFQTINQLDNFQNADTLDYMQVAQNASVSINYNLQQTDKQLKSFGVELSFQETGDKQGGIVRNGNASQFYNGSLMYTAAQVTKGYSFTGSFNITYNTIGRNDFITLGPSLGFNGKFLKKKLTAGTGVAYNAGKEQGNWTNQVLNMRGNAAYSVNKRHSFNLVLLHQRRKSQTRSLYDTTVTVGYNFILG